MPPNRVLANRGNGAGRAKRGVVCGVKDCTSLPARTYFGWQRSLDEFPGLPLARVKRSYCKPHRRVAKAAEAITRRFQTRYYFVHPRAPRPFVWSRSTSKQIGCTTFCFEDQALVITWWLLLAIEATLTGDDAGSAASWARSLSETPRLGAPLSIGHGDD